MFIDSDYLQPAAGMNRWRTVVLRFYIFRVKNVYRYPAYRQRIFVFKFYLLCLCNLRVYATKGMTLEINALRYLKRVGYKVCSMV